MCFSGATVSFIQAFLLVLADTDLRCLEIQRSVGYAALLFLPGLIISTAKLQHTLSRCCSHSPGLIYIFVLLCFPQISRMWVCLQLKVSEERDSTSVQYFRHAALITCSPLDVIGFSGVEYLVSQWQTLGFPGMRVTQAAIVLNKPMCQ